METQKMLHIRIAERGKMHALDQNYKEALRHYKEALRLVQSQKDSELFFQHYSQCVMESLEQSGANDEVISFCENYRAFLDSKETNDLVQKHKSFVCERQGIQHLLKDETEAALVLLLEAKENSRKHKQPITEQLLNWLQRGYQISKQQIHNLQKKHNYFIVRQELINPKIAMDLPQAVTPF